MRGDYVLLKSHKAEQVMAVEVRLIPCLSDNYAVLVHEPESKTTALVDAPEAAPMHKKTGPKKR